jgi:hypothetical protein
MIPKVVSEMTVAKVMVREAGAVEPATHRESVRFTHAASEASAEMTTAEPARMTTSEPATTMSSASTAAVRKSSTRRAGYSEYQGCGDCKNSSAHHSISY